MDPALLKLIVVKSEITIPKLNDLIIFFILLILVAKVMKSETTNPR